MTLTWYIVIMCTGLTATMIALTGPKVVVRRLREKLFPRKLSGSTLAELENLTETVVSYMDQFSDQWVISERVKHWTYKDRAGRVEVSTAHRNWDSERQMPAKINDVELPKHLWRDIEEAGRRLRAHRAITNVLDSFKHL